MPSCFRAERSGPGLLPAILAAAIVVPVAPAFAQATYSYGGGLPFDDVQGAYTTSDRVRGGVTGSEEIGFQGVPCSTTSAGRCVAPLLFADTGTDYGFRVGAATIVDVFGTTILERNNQAIARSTS